MIYDKLSNMTKYVPASVKKDIETFIASVSPDMEEGTYEICGEDVFARVMSYPTKKIQDCKIEAHYEYVDIQFSLVGEEGIDVYHLADLEEIESDPANDVAFYKGPEMPLVRVANKTGNFTLLFRADAHRPQESFDERCSTVKKCVIKIKEALYEK